MFLENIYELRQLNKFSRKQYKKMFGGKGKKKGRSSQKKGFAFGRNKKSKKDAIDPRPNGQNTDSDYGDSKALDVIETHSNNIEVYVDDDDETDQNLVNLASNSSEDAVNGSGMRAPSVTSTAAVIQPQASVVPPEPPKPAAALTEEERKARARKAIEERKKKSRAQIAARRDKKEGKPPPPAAAFSDPSPAPPPPAAAFVAPPKMEVVKEVVEPPLKVETIVQEIERKELRPRTPSEERYRLLELERREEEQALKKEEAEMKELEEALKKEEEEAKRLSAQYDSVVVETINSEELKKEEIEAAFEELENKQGVEAAFEELESKQEVEAAFEELEREEELAKFEAELETALETPTGAADGLMSEFVTIDDESESAVDFVGDVNHRESMREPDLDALLDGSMSFSGPTVLEKSLDGPIKYSEPAVKSPVAKKKTKAATKPKASSTKTKKSSMKSTIPKAPPVPVSKKSKEKPPKPWHPKTKKAPKKPPASKAVKPKKPDKKPPAPKPKRLLPKVTKAPAKKPTKKPPAPKPSKVTKTPAKKPTAPKQPVSPLTPETPMQKQIKEPMKPSSSITNMSHLRQWQKLEAAKKKAKKSKNPIGDSRSFDDSVSSQCTVRSIPMSPYRLPKVPDVPVCKAKYIPKLHDKLEGCQICIFKLSDAERAQYEKNGHHYRVNQTRGGVLDCKIFPSGPGEDPIRISKQCFYDTHRVFRDKEAAFEGTGALSGIQKNDGNYSPATKRWVTPRKS
jgi:hypothetical protein